MKYFIYLITILISIGLTAGIFSLFPILRGVPQLLLVLVIVVAVARKNLDFIFIAIVAGIFLDLLTSLAFGSYILSFAFLGFLSKYIFREYLITSNTWKHLPWIISIAILIQHIWFWVYNSLLFRFDQLALPIGLVDIIFTSFGAIIYTAILFFPAYWMIEKISQFMEKLDLRKKY